MKIKKKDRVYILKGKDKGKTGEVISVLKNNRVIVSGINLVKKHKKNLRKINLDYGIIEEESPIHISNIAILNKTTNKPDKVKYKIYNNKKIRIYKSDGNEI